MKKHLIALTVLTGFITTTSTFAAIDGVYLGGTLGSGNINQQGLTDFPTNNGSNSKGLAGRVFAGYKFNKNIALESGFTKFSNFNATGSGYDPYYGNISATATIKSYAVDVVAKGIMPLQQGLNFFVTLGAAYLNESAAANVNISTSMYDYAGSAGQTTSAILPTFGLGASYDITSKLAVEISWSRIQVLDNTSSYLADTDFVGAGLSYHFG